MQRLPYPAAVILPFFIVAGCTWVAHRNEMSSVIPCQFSPAETWRSEVRCTDHCASEIPPQVRDSAAVTAHVATLARLAARQNTSLDSIRLRARIAYPNGSVGDVTIRESSGDASVDEVALRLVQRLQFVPMKINGLPVATRVDLVLPLSAASDSPLVCTLVSSREAA